MVYKCLRRSSFTPGQLDKTGAVSHQLSRIYKVETQPSLGGKVQQQAWGFPKDTSLPPPPRSPQPHTLYALGRISKLLLKAGKNMLKCVKIKQTKAKQ